jgi:hypothetical protein
MHGDNLQRDDQLGAMLREALGDGRDAFFVTRVQARVRAAAATPTWDVVLARWFWQGLLAAAASLAVAGWSVLQHDATPVAGGESVAVQLLDGTRPGSDVLMMAMTEAP